MHWGHCPSGYGQGGKLALRDASAWRFVTPQDGWCAWSLSAQEMQVYSSRTWVLYPDLNNLEGLGVSTSWDAANPLSIFGPASLFSHAGTGHPVQINKAAEAETASLLYQSDWTGHAEIGLSGSHDLQLKVSEDGSSWTEVLVVDQASGMLSGARCRTGSKM